MNAKQILLLAFLGGAIGATIGFLGTQSLQHKASNSSPSSENSSPVVDLPDPDFLSNYMEEKKNLPAREQALGDRLYACLANRELSKKEKPAEQPEAEESAEDKKSNSTAAVGFASVPAPTDKNKKPAKVEEPARNRAPRPILAVAAKNAEIQQQSNLRYLDVFPGNVIKNNQEDNFGVKNNLSGKIQDFLKDNVCNDPKLSTISEEQRTRSKFFESVKENTYSGTTEIFGESPKDAQKLKTQIQFGSSEHNGMDYIVTRSDQNTTYERRSIDPELASAAWRYNSCGFSVVLVGERCSWSKKYTTEYKDLFYTPDSKKLIGNIYCKNPSDPKWTNVGNIVLSQSGE